MNEQESQLEDSQVERIKTCQDSHFYLNVAISLCFTNFNKNELNFVYSQIIKHFHEVITYRSTFVILFCKIQCHFNLSPVDCI